ncbi:MAG: class I adenylate-forming enzyme family protein [Chitinophagaceae bacterium]
MLDTSLTAANALDRVCRWHPNAVLFHLDKALPYTALNEKDISAAKLLPFVNRMGNLLKHSGMARYDRVAIFKSNSPDYFFLALGVIKAGGIAVPVNPGMSCENLKHYLHYTGSKILITDADIFQQVIKTATNLPVVQTYIFPEMPEDFDGNGIDLNVALDNMPDQLEAAVLQKDSTILIVHTSGTTGFPKGVMSTSGSMIGSVKGHFISEPVSRKNRICMAGFYNHLVYYVGFYTLMLGNYTVYTLDTTHPKKALEAIGLHKANIFFAFSDVYLKMYNEGLDKYDLSSIKLWIATADASHEEHMHAFTQYGAFFKLFGKRIVRSLFIDVIGASEAGSGAIRRFYFSFMKPSYKRMIGRSYFGGPKVKVADENGKRVGAGKPGRMLIKGKAVFKGYWNGHDMLNNVIFNGWWWTGDIVCKDRLGRFYHLDRASDVINMEKGPVYSLPVEEILLTHPDVSEAVVIAVPHTANRQGALAIVYAKTGRKIEEQPFLTWANAQKLPIELKHVSIVMPGDVPRGLTGKVLKRVLREKYALQFTRQPEPSSLIS